MTCLTIPAMALFISLLSVPVTVTEASITIHATQGAVTYIMTNGEFCTGGEAV